MTLPVRRLRSFLAAVYFILQNGRCTLHIARETNEPLSVTLRTALDPNHDGRVTVGEVADRVAERGFGLLLTLLALPTMIPILPPGASGVVGAMYALLGLQMLLGLPHPWLPQKVRRYSLSPRVVVGLQTHGVAFMERLERFSRPRWTFFEQQPALRFVALLIIAIGMVLFLPLPFMNTIPALGLMMIGIGLINRDGLFILLGSLLSLGLLLFLLFFGHLLLKLYAAIKGLWSS